METLNPAPDESPGFSRKLTTRVDGSANWQIVAILLVGALFRLVLLDIKPPHFDEGINGWFVDQMRTQGFYKYDPENYHGPLHFYALFVSLALFGRNLWALRVPVVLVGLATLWLVTRLDRFIGRRASRWAALALAVSPAFVFYNRYSIHETWMEFFLVLALFGIAGLRSPGTRCYLWCLIAGVTGMILTKETYVLHAVAMLLAWPCVTILERWIPSQPDQSLPESPRWNREDLLGGVLTAVTAILFFYSGNFFNWSGISGLWTTFTYWTQTGTAGHGHEKPWHYWLMLLGRFEAPLALGLIAALVLPFLKTTWWTRFIAISSVGTLVGYSIVHYKTPWCILSIAWPFAITFGIGVQMLAPKLRAFAAVLASGVILFSSGLSAKLNFIDYTNPRHPYVYVQTFKDIDLVTKPLMELVRRDRANYERLEGKIICDSYYPLPWLLGDFPNVGYHGSAIPDDPDGDFILVDRSKTAEVEAKLHDTYFTTALTLRDAQEPSKLYLRATTFASLFPGREPEFRPTQ